MKKCMLQAVSALSKKCADVPNISLSRMTIQRRVADISANLTDQLQQKVKEFCFYSFAMDESINCCDTAQLVIYRGGRKSLYPVQIIIIELGKVTYGHPCIFKALRRTLILVKNLLPSINERLYYWERHLY